MWRNNIVAFALCYHRNKNSWKVDLFSFRIWWSHFGGCRSKGAGIVYFWCNRRVSSLRLKVISNKKQLFYMPGLCLTGWIGWKLFCGQLYWWSRWLILTSFTQVSDKLPSNVAIKKICVMVVIFTCCQLFLTVLSTSIWLSLAMYYWLSVWATRQSTYEIFNEFRVFRPSSDFTMAQRYT